MCAESAPVRPSLPPVLWLAVGVLAGVVAAESASWATPTHPYLIAWAVAVTAALASASVALRLRGAAAMVATGLVAGTICGLLFWSDWSSDVRRLDSGAAGHWTGEAVTDPQDGTFGASSVVRLADGTFLSVRWGRGRAPEYGERVEFFGGFARPADDRFGRSAHRKGIAGGVGARAVRLSGPSRSARGVLSLPRRSAGRSLSKVPGPGGALLSGLVTGDRRRLEGSSVECDFRVTGLSHLIAVSGSHLVVVAAVAGWLLGKARLGRVPNALVLAAVLGTYVVFSGVQASALRAWVMSCVVLASRVGFRRADGLAGLGACTCLIVCTWPPCVFDVGFQLSVLAVFGLLVFGRLGEEWVAALLPRFLKGAAAPVSMTLVAQACTLPVSIPTFGLVSLVSPAANVVAAPLIGISLTLGLLGTLLAPVGTALSHAVLMCAGAFSSACASAAAALARVPHACVLLGGSAAPVSAACVACAGLTWTAWPRPRAAVARWVGAVAVAMLLVAGPAPARATDGVCVLGVGQGDAILVRSEGRSMLVDLGPDEQSMRQALLRSGVRELDWVVVTHAHKDHDGGAGALNGTIPVGTVALSAADTGAPEDELASLCEKSGRVVRLKAGDTFTLGAMEVRVLWPPANPQIDENSASVVLLLSGEDLSVLLAGDAESEVLETLAEKGSLPDVDAMKIGHHGSAGSVSTKALDALAPEVAVISVGKGNRFGHPSRQTLDLLGRYTGRVYRTDTEGDVLVAPGGPSPDVRCRPVAGVSDRVRN